MNTDFTNLTTENLSNEHLCCIIRSKKSHPGIEAKRQWLSGRIREGHVFRKLNAKGVVFIEYAPLETAWVPILGDNYYYIYCLWVSGSYKGKGYGKLLMEYCLADAREKGKSGVCMLGAEKQKAWLADQSFAKKFGFEAVDAASHGYELLALSFDGTTPRFAPNAKKGRIESRELTIYYDMQCPFVYQNIEIIKRYCGENDVPVSLIRVDTLQKAKELIDSLKGSKEDIQSEVEKLDKQLNEISGKVKELESQLSKKRQEIANTESALNKAKEQEKKQYRNMKKRIQFMYENGQTSYVEMLLSADSFTDFLNAVEYITQISQYDRKMLKEYQNMQVTIADTQKTLETDYASLQSLQAKVQEEKQAVAALESAKKGELNDVADDLTDAQTVAKAYEAEIQAQNEVIAQIQAAQKRAAEQQAAQQQAQAAEENQGATDAAGENQNTAQNTTPSGNGQSTGSMMWPCPSSKRVTSDYGPRTSPTNGASSNHKGIDIGAAYGADIVAADGGTVLVATYSSSGGNYVIIDHGGGLCTVYMHASSLTVSAGQTVSKGQVIAKVGSTGISTGNHLHFGVTLNGVYVSPWGYVS